MGVEVQTKRSPIVAPAITHAPANLLQCTPALTGGARECACGGDHGISGECEDCKKKRLGVVLRKSIGMSREMVAPPVVHEALNSGSHSMDSRTREFMESRFGYDFSHVKVHSDSKAAESARSVNALAYTVGRDIVFGAGQYQPHSPDGLRLVAHELTHVIQNRAHLSSDLKAGTISDIGENEANEVSDAVMGAVGTPSISRISQFSNPSIQRLCSSAAVCSAPISGSAVQFGSSEEARERQARERRRRMSPQRQRSTSHVGHARQLEQFLNSQAAGLLSNIHGIFIDQDLSPGTGALTMDCASMVPPITGATNPCVFVHGNLNQEALAFNTTADPTVGGMTREDWRVQTLQMLTHEIQHVIFDSSPRPTPAGVTTATCTRANISSELSEINAIMSEFPAAFRAIPAGAPAGDPSRTRLSNWFNSAITNPSEGIRGILQAIGCRCECGEVDAFVIDTFNFVTSSWSVAEKNAFNTELRSPGWGIRWPL